MHFVCSNFVSKLQYFLVDAHIPVSLVVIGTVLSALSAVFEEICHSVMESSDFNEFKSDVGLEIIDTACLFCVAGSDWWANQNLLEDIGVKREIDETREAEGYKFGDGGPVVSSIRVIAPVVVAGTER